jgi:ABC-type Fe3+-siderophore transport system permease subunit
MAFLLPLIGLDALGVSVPGAGLFTAPVVAFQKDKDLDMSTLISLICSCMCSVMIVQRMINFPVKSPPFMMMLAACCLSSCCSSVMVTKDTYDRFTRKSE